MADSTAVKGTSAPVSLRAADDTRPGPLKLGRTQGGAQSVRDARHRAGVVQATSMSFSDAVSRGGRHDDPNNNNRSDRRPDRGSGRTPNQRLRDAKKSGNKKGGSKKEYRAVSRGGETAIKLLSEQLRDATDQVLGSRDALKDCIATNEENAVDAAELVQLRTENEKLKAEAKDKQDAIAEARLSEIRETIKTLDVRYYVDRQAEPTVMWCRLFFVLLFALIIPFMCLTVFVRVGPCIHVSDYQELIESPALTTDFYKDGECAYYSAGRLYLGKAASVYPRVFYALGLNYVGFAVLLILAYWRMHRIVSPSVQLQFNRFTNVGRGSDDRRADAISSGQLKHSDAMYAIVDCYQLSGFSFFGTLLDNKHHELTISLELLAQLLISGNIALDSDPDTTWKRLNSFAKSVHSVNIDRYLAVGGQSVVQDTVFVAYGFYEQLIRRQDELPFPKTPAPS